MFRILIRAQETKVVDLDSLSGNPSNSTKMLFLSKPLSMIWEGSKWGGVYTSPPFLTPVSISPNLIYMFLGITMAVE